MSHVITVESLLGTAEARKITFAASFGYYSRRHRCGCAAAVAAIQRQPHLATLERRTIVRQIRDALTTAEFDGLEDGFEGFRATPAQLADPVYARHFEVGRGLRRHLWPNLPAERRSDGREERRASA